MIRSLATILTLAAGWSFTDLSLDRLRWNARERTVAGIEVLETGKDSEAVDAFETAARLDVDDPTLRFNAGSAHLIAGTEGAIEHLEHAAEFAPETLRAPASYNLGNARLAADDNAGAIAAFEETLRLAPDHQDAKFNLELALQKQQQQEQDQKDQEKQDDKSEPQKQQDQQPENNGDDEEQDQSQGENEQKQPDQPDQDDQEPQQNEGNQNQPLPQFEEQPDMTAEQAAAILEAVENLEREQRRKQAEAEMKKSPRKGKDW